MTGELCMVSTTTQMTMQRLARKDTPEVYEGKKSDALAARLLANCDISSKV